MIEQVCHLFTTTILLLLSPPTECDRAGVSPVYYNYLLLLSPPTECDRAGVSTIYYNYLFLYYLPHTECDLQILLQLFILIIITIIFPTQSVIFRSCYNYLFLLLLLLSPPTECD